MLRNKYFDFAESRFHSNNEIMIGHVPRSIGSFVTFLIRVGELTERALVNAGDLVIIGSGRFICHACLNRRNRIRDRNMITSGTQARNHAIITQVFLSFLLSFFFFVVITRGKLTNRFLANDRLI